MSEHTSDKSIKISGLEPIEKIISSSGKKICVFLNIESNRVEELMENFIVESKLSGHNNEISVVNFYDARKMLLGRACLKYSHGQERKNKLRIESNILTILNSDGIACPKIIDIGSYDEGTPFIFMEVIEGKSVSDCMLDIQVAELILDAIRSHELSLLDNLRTLQLSKENLNVHQKIDFEKKLEDFLRDFTPDFVIKDSYGFLNNYLNDPNVIKKSIVTDRSADNIFIGENNQIVMVDFSTVRIGTQFDNWIQFIDDPRARFSCSKEELIKLFFKKNHLQEGVMGFYHASSIYTNLLQGIFTYQKNPILSMQYINNANDAFEKFTKKKGVLIDIDY